MFFIDEWKNMYHSNCLQYDSPHPPTNLYLVSGKKIFLEATELFEEKNKIFV